jgi:hypothetical protein
MDGAVHHAVSVKMFESLGDFNQLLDLVSFEIWIQQ